MPFFPFAHPTTVFLREEKKSKGVLNFTTTM
jgi:hypothetical protein